MNKQKLKENQPVNFKKTPFDKAKMFPPKVVGNLPSRERRKKTYMVKQIG